MISLFTLAKSPASRAEISDWLKQDDHADYKEIKDIEFAAFLNGLIIHKRGKKEGPDPIPESVLNNNIIFRKLKIALDFKEEDILLAMTAAGFPIGKHELSAFFRKPDHKNYRKCQSQILRNFLRGLQMKLRPDGPVGSKDLPKDDAKVGED